jgi:hypothetical protein
VHSLLVHSVTALLPGDATTSAQEALLARLARHRPRVSFFDVLRANRQVIPVRVHDGTVSRPTSDLPPHLGARITQGPSDAFEILVDHGDVLLPNWGAFDSQLALEVNGQPRVADLDDMASKVETWLEELDDDEDDDPAHASLLRELRAAIDVARRECLPIVACWQ